MIRVIFTLLLLSALVFVFFTFVNRKAGSSWQELKDNLAFIESNLSLLKNTFESEESLKKFYKKHLEKAEKMQDKELALKLASKVLKKSEEAKLKVTKESTSSSTKSINNNANDKAATSTTLSGKINKTATSSKTSRELSTEQKKEIVKELLPFFNQIIKESIKQQKRIPIEEVKSVVESSSVLDEEFIDSLQIDTLVKDLYLFALFSKNLQDKEKARNIAQKIQNKYLKELAAIKLLIRYPDEKKYSSELHNIAIVGDELVELVKTNKDNDAEEKIKILEKLIKEYKENKF